MQSVHTDSNILKIIIMFLLNVKFSVLMSLYAKERPQYLRESLDSVFNQTLKPSEVILVEDGPLTDDLTEVVNNYANIHPELRIVPLPVNGGLGNALNEGLKHCSHELVARMDTDDIAKPDRFEKQLAIFEKYPQVEVVSSWIDEFKDAPTNVISTRKLPEFPYEIYHYAKKRCPINHPAVMFKKDSVSFAGGYQHFPLFEDYFLWIRLLLNGSKLYNVQESLLLFRTSDDMYRRRGGWKHAATEVKFQNHIRKLGFISWYRFVVNITIRFLIRVLPNKTRTLIYRDFLRK